MATLSSVFIRHISPSVFIRHQTIIKPLYKTSLSSVSIRHLQSAKWNKVWIPLFFKTGLIVYPSCWKTGLESEDTSVSLSSVICAPLHRRQGYVGCPSLSRQGCLEKDCRNSSGIIGTTHTSSQVQMHINLKIKAAFSRSRHIQRRSNINGIKPYKRFSKKVSHTIVPGQLISLTVPCNKSKLELSLAEVELSSSHKSSYHPRTSRAIILLV